MKTFELEGLVTLEVFTKVEAETLAEAIALAKDRETFLTGTAYRKLEANSWTIYDIDGQVHDVGEINGFGQRCRRNRY